MARLILILLILTAVLTTTGYFYGASQKNTLVGGGVSQNIINRIAILQEDYKATNGKYLQILEGNRLPHYETGRILDKFGERLPENVSINVYTTPEGQKGYWLEYKDIDGHYSVGFGPHAAEHTWTKLPFVSSTST